LVARASTIPHTPAVSESPLRLHRASGDEARQAWELQRAAFDLPEGGPPVHPGLSDELRVAVRDGRVVSCLTLVHAELLLRGARVSLGGIRHVATHPEEQNRGHASMLMRDTLAAMRRKGFHTSLLFPFSFRYYRKFGYELAGNHAHFWSRPHAIPCFSDRDACRPAAPADPPALAALHRRLAGASGFSLTRDEGRWARVCADPGLQTIVHCDAAGEIDAYLVTAEARDAYGGLMLRVLDIGAETEPGWRGLLGRLAAFPGECIDWMASATELSASGLLRSAAPLREAYKPRAIVNIRPMLQFRVIDVAEAVGRLLPTFPRERYTLALRIPDELLPENGMPLAVRGVGTEVELGTPRPGDPTLTADIRTFSQIYCGYTTPTEAVAQGLADASTPEAAVLADRLFPRCDPFVCELDRF
jgi:predicted N-acetyltransferase YhbS